MKLKRLFAPLLTLCLLLGAFSPLLAQPDPVPEIEPETNADVLIALLGDANATTRKLALNRLIQLHDAKSLAPIAELLKDPEPEIRVIAADGVGTYHDAKYIPQLSTLVNDPEADVRVMVAYALARMRDKAAIAPLVSVLRAKDFENAVYMIDPLPQLVEPAMTAEILPLLKDEEPSIRSATARALRNCIKVPGVVDALLPLLKDGDNDVVFATILSLSLAHDNQRVKDELLSILHAEAPAAPKMPIPKFGVRIPRQVLEAAVVAQRLLRDPRSWDDLLYVAKNCKWQHVQREAIEAIEVIGTREDKRTLPALLDLLKMDGQEVSYAVSHALIRLKDPAIIEPLLSGDGEYAKIYASDVLRSFGEPAVEPMLKAIGADQPANRRINAFTAMIRWPDRRFVGPITTALNDGGNLFNRQTVGRVSMWRGTYDGSAIPNLRPLKTYIAFTPGKLERISWLRDAKWVSCLRELLPKEYYGTRIPWEMAYTGDPSVVEDLIPWLKSDDEYVRVEIVNALGYIGNERAIPALLNIVQDPDEMVRASVKSAFSSFREVKDLTPLLDALKNTDILTRQRAIACLGCLRDRRATVMLINVLKNDTASEVREYAALALGLIGDKRAVDPLCAALKDNAEWARSAAAWALGELQDPRAVKPLEAVLNDNHPRFRIRVADALARIGNEKGIDELVAISRINDRITNPLCKKAMSEIHNEKFVEPLLAGLEGREFSTSVLPVLAEYPDPRVLPDILATLKEEDGNPYAVIALTKIDSPIAREKLADILAENRWDRMRTSTCLPAALALAKDGDKNAIDFLVEQLNDPTSDKINDLIMGVIDIKDERITDGLASQLKHIDPYTQALAGYALAKRGDVRGLPKLLALAAGDEEPFVHVAAAYLLGELRAKEGVASLQALTAGHQIDVRVAAAEALGKIGDKKAAPALITMLREEISTRPRDAAIQALQAISRKKYGEDVKRWDAWWKASKP